MFAMKPLSPEDASPEIEADRIEQKYQVLGITGVEDLLQDNVKECIEDFMEADIKVWMLTGDKGATAKQIGTTCGIFLNDMQVLTPDPKEYTSVGEDQEYHGSSLFASISD